jgi:SUKH-3 immunity protein
MCGVSKLYPQALPWDDPADGRHGTVRPVTDGIDWLRVPGAQRPTSFIPVDPPTEVDGFRFAETSDGANPDGTPRVSPERGYVTDPAERQRLLRYLEQGRTVVETARAGTDRIDPTRRFAVPVSYRTDGAWVWPAAVEYYLRHHQLGLEPEFRRWIERHDYHVPAVPDDVAARAREATLSRSDILAQRKKAYLDAHPESRPGDPGRFPPDVNEALLSLGWRRGRDVRDRVDPWLAGWVDELAAMPFERDGYPRYEPFPAALSVLYEFGGLTSAANGRGRTAAQTPFSIYPTGRDDDLRSFAVDVQLFGARIGQRVFQVGDVERRMGALVVDELGRVFLIGPLELYAGADIDEALVRMLQGIRCDDVADLDL